MPNCQLSPSKLRSNICKKIFATPLDFDLRLLRFLLLRQALVRRLPIARLLLLRAGNDDVSLSPNLNKSFNISYLISQNQNEATPNSSPDSNKSSSSTLVLHPPPPPPKFKKFGIVNDNGMMSDEFEIGEYDPNLVETNWGNENGRVVGEVGGLA
ncbi:hypothetical protein QYF36_002486 [Acer negundo]|nr:hypothetical protein QYF36_002486 [Acer negundo]